MEKANLPDEVIEEILSRLPVESLLRFRCVSKSWLSLISNSHFAKLHFQRSSQHSHRILHMVDSKARSLDFNASLHDGSAVVMLNFPLHIPPHDVQIMGTCRGFLLLAPDFSEEYYIWNPSNGVCKQIPPSSLKEDNVFLYGFGYNEFTDDYLIVVGSCCIPNDYDAVTDVEIFSLRNNSWKKLGNYPYISRGDYPDTLSGSFLNGAFHWVASRFDGQRISDVIIAFDLMEKNFREVPEPDDFCWYGSCDLKVLRGCLSLIDMNGDDEIVIWMMKEYEVKSSWTMHITLSLVDIPTHYISPICFTKDGQIVGIDDYLGLVKYNDKGELLEHIQYCHDPRLYEGTASVYTETLLSLPSDQGSLANQP